MKKIAFIDRDGTILVEPTDKQIDSYQKFSFRPGAIDFLVKLTERNYSLVLVTNQDGLGSAQYPTQIYHDLNALMLSTLSSVGVHFSDLFVCPHTETENCECRKPKLGMLSEALREGFFQREESFVVGDRESDLAFAKNLKVRGYNCETTSWKAILSDLDFAQSYKVKRTTSETTVELELIRGTGPNDIATTIPFFDHMLNSLFRFSGFQVRICASGDTQIDEHHLVEDVALCLGEALKKATGSKRGITRFSQWTPMDESLSKIALDLSGRPSFEFSGEFGRETIGGVSTEMVHHFFKTLAFTTQMSVHIEFQGLNTHHQYESIFKGFGLALRRALKVRGGSEIPSTKGQL